MARLSIAEVVSKLQNSQSKTERLEILKNNDSVALRGILRMNYDNSLKLSLPEGAPPYKKSHMPVGFGETTLLASSRSWYVFSKESAPTVLQSKREFLFIKLLESLDPAESTILLLAKDKKLDLGLTKKVIDEVFPGLIREEVSDINESNIEIAESEPNVVKEKPKKSSVKSSSKSTSKSA